MADVTPMVFPTAGYDGLFGGAGGGGLLGGLILGSLLRNGGLFGGYGDGAGVAAGAMWNNPQNQANMSVMSTLGDIKQAVAVSSANMETSQAQQSSTIQGQLNQIAGALTNTVNGVKDVVVSNDMALMGALNGVDKSVAASTVTTMNGLTSLDRSVTAGNAALSAQLNGVEKSTTANTIALMSQVNGLDTRVMQSQNSIERSITADGDKTRALIVQQYEASLNRQLGEANAALAELRAQQHLATATRSIEVNTTNNINQMQAQSQQQQQMQLLTGIMSNLANDLQYIRATNQAINIGGTQTANPLNTNTQIR